MPIAFIPVEIVYLFMHSLMFGRHDVGAIPAVLALVVPSVLILGYSYVILVDLGRVIGVRAGILFACPPT